MMGNYAYKAASKLLLGGKQDDASVSNFDKKRFIYFEEPAFKQKLQSHIIKDMTGGNEVAARKLYSQDTCTTICATFALNTNNIPEFTQADAAIDDRLITYEWISKFVKDPAKVNEMENVYLADENIGTKQFAERYGSQLFNILCEYHQKFMNNNQEISLTLTQKKNNSEILKISDGFKSWFETNVDFTEKKGDYISLADITQRFRVSEHWLNLTTSNKSCGAETYVKKQLMNRAILKKCYRKEKVISKGKRGYAGYLIKHKFKSNSILNEYIFDNQQTGPSHLHMNEFAFNVDEDDFNTDECGFNNYNTNNKQIDLDNNCNTNRIISSGKKKRLRGKTMSTELDYPNIKRRKLN